MLRNAQQAREEKTLLKEAPARLPGDQQIILSWPNKPAVRHTRPLDRGPLDWPLVQQPAALGSVIRGRGAAGRSAAQMDPPQGIPQGVWRSVLVSVGLLIAGVWPLPLGPSCAAAGAWGRRCGRGSSAAITAQQHWGA